MYCCYQYLVQTIREKNLSFAQVAAGAGIPKIVFYSRILGLTPWKMHEAVNICNFLEVEASPQLFLR